MLSRSLECIQARLERCSCLGACVICTCSLVCQQDMLLQIDVALLTDASDDQRKVLKQGLKAMSVQVSSSACISDYENNHKHTNKQKPCLSHFMKHLTEPTAPEAKPSLKLSCARNRSRWPTCTCPELSVQRNVPSNASFKKC